MNTDIVTMKTLILFLLSAVLVFGQAANDQLITQRKPDNSGNIQRNVPMESAISTTLASYRSALGLGTEDDPQFNTVRINDSDGSHYLGIAAGSDLTADRTLTITTGDANRTLTLGSNVAINQDLQTSSYVDFAGVQITNSFIGWFNTPSDKDFMRFWNTSTSTFAAISSYIGNDASIYGNLTQRVNGTGFTTSGLNIQDGASILTGINLSGGLVIGTQADAALIFAQNNAEVGRFNVSGQFETPVQIFTEGSAPSTPTSGRVAMYAKTDGRLYSMDDAGTETELGGGGGGDATLAGNNAFTGDNSFAGSSTFTGITAFSAAEEIVYTAMPALEVDVTKAGNSYSATGDVTFTYSDATPAAGTSTYLRITADGTNRTITIPTTWSLARGGNITSLLVPAGTVLQVKLQYLSGRWEIIGDPVATTGTGSYVLAGSPALTGTPTAPTAAPGTNTTQLATTAFVQANSGGMVSMFLGTIAGSPAASTTSYAGFGGIGFTTVEANRQVTVPVTGTIRTVVINWYTNGTAGSNESVPLVIRHNSTTDYAVASVAATSLNKVFANYSMNSGDGIAVTAGDTISIKLVAPAWETPPTNVVLHAHVIIEL